MVGGVVLTKPEFVLIPFEKHTLYPDLGSWNINRDWQLLRAALDFTEEQAKFLPQFAV